MPPVVTGGGVEDGEGLDVEGAGEEAGAVDEGAGVGVGDGVGVTVRDAWSWVLAGGD